MSSLNPLSSSPTISVPLETPATGESAPTSRASGLLSGLSLTILGPTGQIEGPGGEIRIRLENPTVGPEDVPLSELLQQTDSILATPGPVLIPLAALAELEQATVALSGAIRSGEGTVPADVVRVIAQDLEHQTTVVERSLRDMIENSTYPNFSEFLKEMVQIAQELREKATMAKLAAIEGNYSMMMLAADQMLVAAEKSKESREKQIEAEKQEANSKIIGGAFGFVLAFVPGVGAALSTASSQIVSGAYGGTIEGLKTESSTLQYDADLANVAKQRLEASAKLIDSQAQIADDLRDIAKGLRDMMLKLYQDFISAQNQTLQRAINV